MVRSAEIRPVEPAAFNEAEGMFMKIIYNDQEISLSDGSRLTDFLQSENLLGQSGIALALNDEVIPRARWSDIEFKNNDQLLVVQATQGG